MFGINSSVQVKVDTSTLSDELCDHQQRHRRTHAGYTVISTGKLHHDRGRYRSFGHMVAFHQLWEGFACPGVEGGNV